MPESDVWPGVALKTESVCVSVCVRASACVRVCMCVSACVRACVLNARGHEMSMRGGCERREEGGGDGV